jgi:hypothetical protein
LALARIGLDVAGRKWPRGAPTIAEMYSRNEFLQNIAVASWACLAACPGHEWLTGGVTEFS